MTMSRGMPLGLTEPVRTPRPVGDAVTPRPASAGVPPAVVTRLADFRHPDDSAPGHLPRPNLSDREVEVLLAWLAAESKEEAAGRLFISASTVSTHLARIRAKYAVVGRTASTKTQLFARALQDGYTSIDRW